MNKKDLGEILSTQLVNCMGNRTYGHSSTMDHKYSHLSEEGKALMMELIDNLAPLADKIRREEIKVLAEEMVIANLKK